MSNPLVKRSREAKASEPTISDRRRALALKGPAEFAKVYLPHLLVAQDDIEDALGNIIIAEGTKIEFSELAHELFGLANTKRPSKAREAVVAPRGFAKSTIFTIIVLYWAAFRYREFVLWTSETASQVEELVASLIDELEGNLELVEDFPHLVPKKDNRGNTVKFNDRDIVLDSDFRLSARGARKATRGLRRGAKRPDAVLCDDAEGEDTTGETGYPKVRRWLTRVLAPALSPKGDIYWVNTLIDWESVTGALIRGDEDWTQTYTVRHLQAEWYEDVDGERVDVQTITYDDGKPYTGGTDEDPLANLEHLLLWPEYWPQERLDAFKKENGELAYSFEMLNKPMAEGDKVFRDPDWLKWCTFEGNAIYREGHDRNDWMNANFLTYVTFIDPAFGGKDYAAVVTVGVFQHDFFVREAWWERGVGIRIAQVTETVRQAEFWGSKVIGVENVAAQILLADEFIRKSRIPVEPVSPGSKSKVDRAMPVAVRASQGHVYFESGIPMVRALREILVQFPGPAIDDPVDAAVYAIETAAMVRSKFLISTAG